MVSDGRGPPVRVRTAKGLMLMADDPQFYRARAAAEHAVAQSATLENVRMRAERAERAWLQMAERAESVRAQRDLREAAAAAVRLHASP